MRALVIGAGAAGLVAARRLREAAIGVVLMENNPDLGGVWRYDEMEDDGTLVSGAASSLYNSLRTNLPKEIMFVPDLEFPAALPSFVHHTDVHRYLQSFATAHGLLPHIRFGRHVEAVRPIPRGTGGSNSDTGGNAGPCWGVSHRGVANGRAVGEPEEDEFDFVCVCSGHFHTPFWGEVPGLDRFPGRVLHSHNYRVPDTLAPGKRVLLVGGGPSGIDISIELGENGSTVFLSHVGCTTAAPSDKQDNVTECPPLKEIRADGSAEFQDGTVESGLDAVVMCTGYEYAFPFLPPGCVDVSHNAKVVTPLYKHVFHAKQPSLAFVGIPWQVLPFYLFDVQSQWIARIWSGKATLPSSAEMLAHMREDRARLAAEGQPPRYAHKLGPEQWGYMRGLIADYGLEPFQEFREAIYRDGRAYRARYTAQYREALNYKLDLASGQWQRETTLDAP
eukprot:m.87046 g.87046  ORF g.87046 m.87046 type:complete len:448 (+) comp8448_c0_seq3:150-1493(+)